MYAIIGILGILDVLVVALVIYFINAEAQRPGLEIRVDDQGLTVDGNG